MLYLELYLVPDLCILFIQSAQNANVTVYFLLLSLKSICMYQGHLIGVPRRQFDISVYFYYFKTCFHMYADVAVLYEAETVRLYYSRQLFML